MTNPTRRDVLLVGSVAAVAMNAGLASSPVVAKPASPRPVTVDLGLIAVGHEVTVAWDGLPVVIRHRSRDEIERSQRVVVDRLVDPLARNAAFAKNALATDANRTRADRPEWLVMAAICTHLACRLTKDDGAAANENKGWFCPCHAARFDEAGRVLSGPARTNLTIPPYRFLSNNRMLVGRL